MSSDNFGELNHDTDAYRHQMPLLSGLNRAQQPSARLTAPTASRRPLKPPSLDPTYDPDSLDLFQDTLDDAQSLVAPEIEDDQACPSSYVLETGRVTTEVLGALDDIVSLLAAPTISTKD